jgi:hypothetical protein
MLTVDINKLRLIILSIDIFLLTVCNGQALKQCYESDNNKYCYCTDGALLGFTEARQHCLNMNATLPIVTSNSVQTALKQFMSDSMTLPGGLIGGVWLGAHTVPINSSSPWHWIDGRPSNYTPNIFAEFDYEDGFGDTSFVDTAWCSSATSILSDRGRLKIESQDWFEPQVWYICRIHNDNTNCSGGFMYRSQCYRYYGGITSGDQTILWFTAVNKCLSANGSLAVFDDDFLTNLTLPWLDSQYGDIQAWIGLIRTWWIWSDAAVDTPADVLYNKFIMPESRDDLPVLPYNPPARPNSTNDYCAIATAAGYWLAVDCNSHQRHVICQTVTPMKPRAVWTSSPEERPTTTSGQDSSKSVGTNNAEETREDGTKIE